MSEEFTLYGLVLPIFIFGVLYCFYGKKYFTILHAIASGIMGLGIFCVVLFFLTENVIVGIVGGLAAGIGCGL